MCGGEKEVAGGWEGGRVRGKREGVWIGINWLVVVVSFYWLSNCDKELVSYKNSGKLQYRILAENTF